MEQSIFRKNSRKTLESPEELTDYIAVTGPRVWIVLCAFLALLLGGIAWAMFGWVETVVTENGIAHDGIVSCYLTSTQYELVSVGQSVNIDDVSGEVTYVSDKPESYEESCERLGNNAYVIFVLGIQKNDWQHYAEITPNESLDDGPATVNILVEQRHPISFILEQEGDK